ncbi:hypothetical protein LGL88_12165 [Yersinia ruckeri]|uniref:hypothetical protein n=1 Tax=Yersinia ruckeri TaxID=29486 RepID=UPI0011A232C0|nr:hypothetical protein [Yersinia ruckeri]EKN4704220.1 hypothetical protein [Yersinia ruckeri]UIN06497.1 hypothetical protein LGL88_12165 [Yersinia ruckeri]
MKELEQFTVERLEGLIGDAETWSFVKLPSRELKALARIALAAKRAEPAIIFNEPNSLAYRNLIGNFPVGTKFYTTPQLNYPEIPEGWNGTLETAAKLIDVCRAYTILGNSGSYRERTINDCELTMQEIESYLAAAAEKENG